MVQLHMACFLPPASHPLSIFSTFTPPFCTAYCIRSRHAYRISLTMATPTGGRDVLVTGATGFLGTHLVDRLAERGYNVHSVSRRASDSPTHYVCDLAAAQGSEVESILCDKPWAAIFHLAGLVSYSPKDADEMQHVNVGATCKLIDGAIAHCPSAKFLYCSSVVAIGSNAGPDDPLVDEDHPWDPSLEHIGYVRTKKAAQNLVAAAGKSGRLRAASLCPSNIFGARDGRKASRKSQVKAANGRMRLYTHGGLSVVHVDVVVAAFLALLETDADSDVWQGSAWLVTGENVNVREMLSLYAKHGGNETHAPWLSLPNWLLMLVCVIMQALGSSSITVDRFTLASRYNWYNGSRARRQFQLPEISADECVRASAEWMHENGMVQNRR